MQITEYNETAAGLERLKGRMQGVVYDVTTKDGMLSAKTDRRELVSLRTTLEAKRKEIKAPALERCKLIDEEAKRVTAEILALETPIDQQIKAEEVRLEAIRKEAFEKEKQRVMKIMESIEKLKAYPVRCSAMKSAELRDTITFIQSLNIVSETYQEFIGQAIDAKAAVVGELVALCEIAEANEAEEARIEAERLAEEAARQEAERVERERLRVEQDRVSAEAEALRKEREEFARQQDEAARIRGEEDRKNRESVEIAERAFKAEREAAAARIAEEQAKQQEEINRQAAELKRKQDEMAETLRKAEAEAKAAREAETEKQRELDCQAAIAAEAQRAATEKARRVEAKARKLAEAKCLNIETALVNILVICRENTISDTDGYAQIALIVEANGGAK
jgi:hypothetical protein